MDTTLAKPAKGRGGKKVRVTGRNSFREWVEFFITLILMVFFIRVTTVEAFRIPTGSMENTLLVGDFLLVNKFIYGIRTPDRIGIPFTDIGFNVPSHRLPGPRKIETGDIIVFKFPGDSSLNYIKRCVAIPGQTVEVRNRQLYVDGKIFKNPPGSKFISRQPRAPNVREPNIFAPRDKRWNRDNYGPLTVPPGKYFVMGDNRDNSADSRYWGFLSERAVVGKAMIIYFSFNKHVSLSKFYKMVRWNRIGNWIE